MAATARFYDQSDITYDESDEVYDGVPAVFTPTTGISFNLVLAYSTLFTYYTHFINGMIDFEMLLGSPIATGFIRTPLTSDLTVYIVPNSSIIIRNYKKIKDPVVTGGCPQCGTYLYN